MQAKRVLAALVITLTALVATLGFAAPAGATTGVTVSGTTLGTTITVSSPFVQPSSGQGNYVVDTEIYGPNGSRVAQFAETVWLSSSSNVRKYSLNTNGFVAGTYRVAQGIFTPNWSANRSWVSNAGSFTLSSGAQQLWKLESSVSGSGSVAITSKFTAASNFARRNVVLDTEIYGPSGTKVKQWAETVWVSANQTIARNYTWSTADKPVGNYSIKQGVFGQNWNGTVAWKGDGARFVVSAPTTTTTTAPALVSAPVAAPAPVQSIAPTSGSHPFWVDPTNPAARQAKDWASSRPADAARMQRIADAGAAVWLGGSNSNVQADVSNVANAASQSGKTPVFVAYNIPNRDCGSYSAGGASGGDAYRSWITAVVNGIGDKKAWVVLEPDALSQLDCLDASSRGARLELLRGAVNTLESKPNVDVYIDAGHPGWHSASEMSNRLRSAGVDRARGFSLNVSNFSSTNDNAIYGESVAALLGGKKYVVDTSRNGNGSNGEWCNPSGRAVGATPTVNTGKANADAYLWIKRPGESDGTCNGGPSAGQWWSDYALGLATRAWG